VKTEARRIGDQIHFFTAFNAAELRRCGHRIDIINMTVMA